MPLATAVLVAAVLWRPRLFRGHRAIDAALCLALLVASAQLVPLPARARLLLSPSSAALDRSVLLNPPADPLAGPSHPLSIDPESSGWALATALVLVLLYWTARGIMERRGGSRLVVRGIAWLGLALAAEMFLQRMVSPDLIYGFWRPIARIGDPHPIGPFLNRNDLAAWLAMAIPLVAAYALTRVDERIRERAAGRAGPDRDAITASALVDTRMIWLGGSICLMLAALVASLSRSGFLAASTALAALAVGGRDRLSRRALAWFCGSLALLGLAATVYADVPALAARFGETLNSNFGGRPEIWRDTWQMVRDFPLTGVGVGAFERGMVVYQRSTRLLFFNHAHNEYLQLLAEGGLLLIVPAAAAIVAGAISIARQLRADQTPMFWLRAGAASAMIAAATQSCWDTGLRMPANGALFAIAAAIASHERPDRGRTSPRGPAALT